MQRYPQKEIATEMTMQISTFCLQEWHIEGNLWQSLKRSAVCIHAMT